MKYKVCEECGAHLDSNETCECKERKGEVNEVSGKEVRAANSGSAGTGDVRGDYRGCRGYGNRCSRYAGDPDEAKRKAGDVCGVSVSGRRV